jgi:hypothetical protein
VAKRGGKIAGIEPLALMGEIGIGIDKDPAPDLLPDAAEAIILGEIAARFRIDHDVEEAIVDAAFGVGGGIVTGTTNALADSSTAVGEGSNANFANSTAVGAGAQTTRANQQSFGTASNTYTMAGITSNASKLAQGVPTTIVTSNAAGDLAAYSVADLGLATDSDLNAINNRLNALSGRTDKALSGVAMTFAMAGVPELTQNERFALMGNWGTFQGENGLAMNGAVRLAKNVQLNGGVAWAVNQDLAGGRAGVRGGW